VGLCSARVHREIAMAASVRVLLVDLDASYWLAWIQT
jgi:hypothetical protein